MANFSVVIDSKFDPFSYEELIKPIDRQNTEHRLIEQGMAELDTQASVLENMADMEKDPVSYARYKQYALDLREKAAILAAKGLDGTNRQDMYNMKSRYAKEIVPIQTAYATRKAQEDEQRKLQAQDDTVRFSYNAGERSLDDFLLDPSLSYNSYKGSTIEKQVSEAAKNIKAQLRDNKSYWANILENQYYEHIMRYGLTADEVLNTITGIENGTNTGFAPLRDLIMSSVDGIGLKNWKGLTNEDGTLNEKGRELYNDALYYAGRGAYSSIGTTEFKELANQEWELMHKGSGNDKIPAIKKLTTSTGEMKVDSTVDMPETTMRTNTLLGVIKGLSDGKSLEQIYDDISDVYDASNSTWAKNAAKRGFFNSDLNIRTQTLLDDITEWAKEEGIEDSIVDDKGNLNNKKVLELAKKVYIKKAKAIQNTSSDIFTFDNQGTFKQNIGTALEKFEPDTDDNIFGGSEVKDHAFLSVGDNNETDFVHPKQIGAALKKSTSGVGFSPDYKYLTITNDNEKYKINLKKLDDPTNPILAPRIRELDKLREQRIDAELKGNSERIRRIDYVINNLKNDIAKLLVRKFDSDNIKDTDAYDKKAYIVSEKDPLLDYTQN